MWNCWLSYWDQLWEEGSYLLSVLTEINPYFQSLPWSLLMLSTSFKCFRQLLSYYFNTVVLIYSLSVLHGQMELQLVLLAIIIRKCGVFLPEPILSVKFWMTDRSSLGFSKSRPIPGRKKNMVQSVLQRL